MDGRLQTLHCIEYEAEGGYNTLTDGFRAAAELQRTAPDAYEFFSTVRLPFRYRDLEKGHDLRYEGLVLQHRDCEVRIVFQTPVRVTKIRANCAGRLTRPLLRD